MGEKESNSSFNPSFKNHSKEFFCTSIRSGKSSNLVLGIPIGVTLFAYFIVDINSPRLLYLWCTYSIKNYLNSYCSGLYIKKIFWHAQMVVITHVSPCYTIVQHQVQ